jgi:hypothetical protein
MNLEHFDLCDMSHSLSGCGLQRQRRKGSSDVHHMEGRVMVRFRMAEMQHALSGGPTPTWREGFNRALGVLEHFAVQVDDGALWEISHKDWAKAMSFLCRLPSGGRWVHKERGLLRWRIERAVIKEGLE